jgi:HEAT repeat protein
VSNYATPVPSSRDEALRALGTEDAELRRLVVRALEQSPVDTACDVLPVVLGDDDWRVRKEGIQLAHALAERADIVSVLVEALRSPSDQVALRNAAVEALAGLGAAAAPSVEDALTKGNLDADGRKLAIDVLAGARQPRSTPVLIDALGDVDPNVRYAAAEALGLIGGPDAIEALQSMLGREDRFLRLVALEGLNRLDAIVPEVILRGFLQDKILRHAAIAALGRTGDPDAIGALIGALDDASRHVGETAMRALSAVIRDDADSALRARELAHTASDVARKRVLDAAGASDPTVRRAALPVLALFADAAHGTETDALLRALQDPDVAEDAEAALETLGASILPALIDVARRGEVPSRAAALAVLPKLPANAEAIDVLRDGLRDPDRTIVAAAAQAFASALASGTIPNAADVHALLRVASGRDATRGTAAAKAAAVALQSLRTLARVRPEAVRPHLAHVDVGDDEAPVVCALLAVAGGPEHVSWLSRAAAAPSARTRRAAVEALGQIGGAAAESALGYAVTDESQDVALGAIKALGRLRDDNDRPLGANALLRLIDAEGDESVVAAAVRALGQTRDNRAVAALTPLASSPRVPVACAAVEALADLGVDRSILYSALHHASSVVARTALDVLDTTLDERNPALAAELTVALAHGSWEVRRRAIEVLSRLDPMTVRPLLASRLAIESEASVRDALDRALLDLDRRMARPSRPPPSDPPEGT